MPAELKPAIQSALAQLRTGDFFHRATTLFQTLGYQSQKVAPLPTQSADELLELYDQERKFRRKEARVEDWNGVDILFQLTDAEVKDALSGQNTLFQSSAEAVNGKIIQSYLFVAVELEGETWNKGDLAQITREINKLFPMPALVLFKHGALASLGITDRRLNKTDNAKDVIERKVTLIKDIRLENPHRAHIEILAELSLQNLRDKFKVSNFVELDAAWRETLNISELNKRFYRELSNWYFWAVQNVEFPRPKTDNRSGEEHRAMSVIRLITRLIFVWFIKERDLVPDALFERPQIEKMLKSLAPNESSYYRGVLQNLFFATLNTELGEQTRQWVSEERFQGHNPDFGMDKWRFPELFHDAEKSTIEALFRQVPFLNGGLFRRLDDEDKNEYFDGFTRRAPFQPRVPNFLFWGDEQKADLNAAYGSKGREYRVKGLLSILKSYVFTVAENTPLDEEVALDPELLGKVFENLLASYNPETASTARKQTGSFYTPRPIVEYLVESSLCSHLQARAPGVKDADLRALLSPDTQTPALSEGDKDALIAAIHGALVLDPACGSGAFVMGALDKMVRLLRKIDPRNERFFAEEKRKIRELKDRKSREVAMERMEKIYRHDSADYLRKLVLIERCIHGVDIQPIATQIAKLRIFISLAVEQTVDRANPDNYGIESLPNLETKIVAANTLRALEKPIDPDIFTNAKQEELRVLVEEYFTCYRRPRKKAIEAEVETLFSELGDYIEQTDKAHKTDAALVRKWKFWNQNDFAPFFDRQWMFGKAVEKGFDIIIGNPPFGAKATAKDFAAPTDADAIKLLKKKFTTFGFNRNESYVAFIEVAVQNLSEGGMLAYICPDTFLNLDFTGALRGYLLRETKMREIVLLPSGIFETATVDTALLLVQRHPVETFNVVDVRARILGKRTKFTSLEDTERDFLINTESWFGSDAFNIAVNEVETELLKRFESCPKTIGGEGNGIGEVFSGVKTYEVGKGTPPQSREIADAKPFTSKTRESKRFLPMRDGKHIGRYADLWAENNWVDYGPWLAAPRSPQNFEGEKILIRKIIAERLIATYIPETSYCNTLLFVLKLFPDCGYSYKFVLALLNSRAIAWYFRRRFQISEQDTFPQIMIKDILKFPIPAIPPDNHRVLIERLADYLLFLNTHKPKETPTLLEANIYRLLDGLIYELYVPEAFENRLKLSEVADLADFPEPQNADWRAIYQKHFSGSAQTSALLWNLSNIETIRTMESVSKVVFVKTEVG